MRHTQRSPIGVFDSGYGGLTVLKELHAALPEHDFIYLGDSKRAPYGPLPFDTVYQYTLEAVKWFFKQGCQLVVLACNTASAKALRTIQQNDLPRIDGSKRVLGVIRPTSEIIGEYTKTDRVGIVATAGTVQSQSYVLEIAKFFPGIKVTQEACPEWVELVESGRHLSSDADAPVRERLNNLLTKSSGIDTVLLACTHYPLLIEKIKEFTPGNIKLIEQGNIVARSLVKYLERHPEINALCSKEGELAFYTTGALEDFNTHAPVFFGGALQAKTAEL